MAGERDKLVFASAQSSAKSFALTCKGVAGYYLVPAGAADIQEPDFPTVTLHTSFAASLAEGPLNLSVAASDANGHFGPSSQLALEVVSAPVPQGELVFSLSWDTNADLDLHVVDPTGVEVWARNINSYQPPGPGQPPAAPDAYLAGGILDYDSNAACVIDGRRRENITWASGPPSGRYLVRVAVPSLCGQAAAHWRLEARVRGEIRQMAEGWGLTEDVQAKQGAGSGVLAMQLDFP
jgi:hypothetical protein